MAISIETKNRSIIKVNIDGKEQTFIINYNEQNIVTKVARLRNHGAIELYSFSKFDMFKNIHIDDMNEKIIRLIYNFNRSYWDVWAAIIDAKENRENEKY